MKLSEAIRLGAMTGQKSDGFFFRANGATCAQGAALVAMGVKVGTRPDVCTRLFDDFWPWAVVTMAYCPACTNYTTIKRLIPHLNNRGFLGDHGHDWPREHIADWVETQEAIADRRLQAEPSTPDAERVTAAVSAIRPLEDSRITPGPETLERVRATS